MIDLIKLFFSFDISVPKCFSFGVLIVKELHCAFMNNRALSKVHTKPTIMVTRHFSTSSFPYVLNYITFVIKFNTILSCWPPIKDFISIYG